MTDQPVKNDTADSSYADRLERLTSKKWKVILDVQRPYRWNLKRLNPGTTLDVGCGIGRNLVNLPEGSVGVDHNRQSVSKARALGCDAHVPEEFFSDPRYESRTPAFDSILLGHVLEHMTLEDSGETLDMYLPYLKEGGRVIVICPQEKGYATDETHVTFLDCEDIGNILRKQGLEIDKTYSFPFPRRAGKVFRYNETIVVARK